MSMKKRAWLIGGILAATTASAALAQPGILFVEGDNVGIGTAAPVNKLHVLSTGSGVYDGKVLIENGNSGPAIPREGLEVKNNGQALMVWNDISQPQRWAGGTFGTSWVIDNQANGGIEMVLQANGSVSFQGTVTPGSSRSIKRGFEAVNPSEVLSKVLDLPITSWSYQREPGVRHIGPMSEDFFATFSVGGEQGISVTDSAGVALAAIQGLQAEIEERDQEIAGLQRQLVDSVAVLEARIEELRARLDTSVQP